MVFNSLLVLSVANKSADVWQYIACFPERISSDQLVDLVCCLPLQQLGRFALCLWSFFCLPPSPDSYYHSHSYYDSDSDSSSSISYYHHDGDYDSHSD
ncbi:Serine/threonine-protein kinase pats1 [Actinidia chinensis var. chinensis]|uniref:Serine/threonine-protein kinase pats1 n=1 Tax=Actinidia chinensis var. chinensis TaxID=1590841 RepID=A0A2R6PG42_ACTCC|nr:Serine/threonine-protein kinase pats1 [Actinidia chinensis var. chinensis]